MENSKNSYSPFNNFKIMLILQFLALTIPFLFVIIITLIKSDEKRKQNQFQADLYFKALEKGQASPVDLTKFFAKPQKKLNPLSVAAILMLTGIGISLTIWFMSMIFASVSQDAAKVFISLTPVGIMPFIVGVAYVIIYFIEKKKDGGENAQ
jgi:sterol desaturase/sphingolipid hydroxylase (fatty acid hydroxylase superfamily)